MARLAESLALEILGFKARSWSCRPLDDLLSDNLHVILFFFPMISTVFGIIKQSGFYATSTHAVRIIPVILINPLKLKLA
jgi:hypothetical protein